MKHFKTISLILIVSLISNFLVAQKGYIEFETGYGISLGSQTMGGNYTSNHLANYDDDINTYYQTSESVSSTLGKGLVFGVSYGYMFTKHVGAEMGVSYIMSGKVKTKNLYTATEIRNSETNIYFDHRYNTKSANMLKVTPSIVFATQIKDITAYSKFGLIVGKGYIMNESSDEENHEILITTQKLYGGLAVGINASIGMLYQLSKRISIVGELNTVNLSYSPTKGTMTEYTFNGKDYLADIPLFMKETEFVDSISSEDYEPDESKPMKAIKQEYPFGSVGFNIGIRINLIGNN